MIQEPRHVIDPWDFSRAEDTPDEAEFRRYVMGYFRELHKQHLKLRAAGFTVVGVAVPSRWAKQARGGHLMRLPLSPADVAEPCLLVR